MAYEDPAGDFFWLVVGPLSGVYVHLNAGWVSLQVRVKHGVFVSVLVWFGPFGGGWSQVDDLELCFW